jgi:hypothetical protein
MSEPTATRPRFPDGYGIASSEEGMLPWSWAVERLEAGRNYWVATTNPDRSPHAMPVWGLWLDDAVLFGTSPESRKGRNLARDPRAVVHLESGDDCVILEGEVESVAIDDRVADAFEAKYDWRPDPAEGGLWLRLAPRVAYAWLERDYPSSATRFAFQNA